MKKPDKVIFFSNGNTMAFNKNGEQMPEFQKSWMQLYIEFLKSKNINPTKVEFELPMGTADVFECKDEEKTWYNWWF